jgi:L-lactate dehydrogenase complex protein LldE
VNVALFAPCFVDQLRPAAAIAALQVLERLGVRPEVPAGAVCCGQPPANAGFEHAGNAALARFINAVEDYDAVVVLSGSCAAHIRTHAASLGDAGARVAGRTFEFTEYLHDVVGLERVASLGALRSGRAAVHIGCHALRTLGLAVSTELRVHPYDKVRALLGTVSGLELVDLERADECCGFGGSFAVTESVVSARIGRDRLADVQRAKADLLVSTDASCLLHLGGLARRDGQWLPMLHVAEVLAAPGASA